MVRYIVEFRCKTQCRTFARKIEGNTEASILMLANAIAATGSTVQRFTRVPDPVPAQPRRPRIILTARP